MTISLTWVAYPAKGHQPEFAGMPQDKILHFTVSEFGTSCLLKTGKVLTGSKTVTTTNRIISSLIMLGVGYAKEKQDMELTGNDFDTGDFQADILGIVAGNILHWEF